MPDIHVPNAEPKVGVLMLTYNHEKFIAQALESVFMQKADFPFELVIGDDCSTDGTREIVREYSQKYPEIIRAHLRERNIGGEFPPSLPGFPWPEIGRASCRER